MVTSEARRTPPMHGDEAETLRAFLDLQRDTFRWKCSGLSTEQLHQGLAPTTMTLAGMVLHLTMVEAGWFNLHFAGGVAMPGWLALADTDDPDWSWNHAREHEPAQLWQWYDEAVAVSDEVVERALAGDAGLDTRAADETEPVSLRWLLCHMIEEYARHVGHADLLRQSIDGEVGE